MKNPFFLFALCLLTTIVFSKCEKRPVADIELFGQIVDTTSTGSTPLMGTVRLWTGATPTQSGSTYFGQTTTNGDGTFIIKSKAGWNSSKYSLQFLTTKGNYSREYFVPRNGSVDVGVIAF